MHASYSDITSRLGQPIWYDENGTPRYAPFEPELLPDIYATEAVLYEIACASCGNRFLVADSWSVGRDILRRIPVGSLRRAVEEGGLHYGDPPYHHSGNGVGTWVCGGATMNCDDLRVVEFWDHSDGSWKRVHQLEIVLPDDGEEGR